MEISKEQFLERLIGHFQKDRRNHKKDLNGDYRVACGKVEVSLTEFFTYQRLFKKQNEKVHLGKTFGMFGFDIG